jgi:DNA-binding PadR family transcriptional regulator
MKNFQKAMLIKELLEQNQIIGYHFKKKMKEFGIEISNGSIYYHLKHFHQKGYVVKEEHEKTTIYKLTDKGRKALSENIATIPKEIEHVFMLIASNIPSTNWNNLKDVQVFLERIEHVGTLVKERIRDLK